MKGALAPHHLTVLREESGVSEEVIAARGYFTATVKARLTEIGFAPVQARVPALGLPVWSVHGKIDNYQIRPDQPRIRNGKVVKYEMPAGSTMLLDVPPPCRPLLDNPHIPVIFTEGLKKADSLASQGCCAVALLGVWNWRGSNAQGGKVALPDWEMIAINDRQVYIVFDSDVMLKREVSQALARLKPFLESRHAHVALMYLPAGKHGEKIGVDDYLVAGHTIDDLLQLATSELRSLPVETATGAYQATPQGLLWQKPTKDGSVPIQLTNFTATITTETVEDDGAETRLLFTLETRLHGKTHCFQMPATQRLSANLFRTVAARSRSLLTVMKCRPITR